MVCLGTRMTPRVSRQLCVVFVMTSCLCVLLFGYQGHYVSYHTTRDFFVFSRSRTCSENQNNTLPVPVRQWLGDLTRVPLTLTSNYVINPSVVCPRHETLEYILLVKSSTVNFRHRNGIRETFGQRNFGNIRRRVVFLLGLPSDHETSLKVYKEAEQYGDVIQGHFLDTYRNLTLKSVMGLRWISEYCPFVKSIITIDDDMFLNVFRINSFLISDFSNRKKSIKCFLQQPVIMRDADQKWRIHPQYFPGLTYYPFQYCPGLFVIMTHDVIKPLLEAARVTPVFWVDDVYIYGLLTSVAGNITMLEMNSIERQWVFNDKFTNQLNVLEINHRFYDHR